jgi:uncharacterized YigZ family protein
LAAMAFSIDPGLSPRSETVIKRSRFVAVIGHASTEEEALEFLRSVRERERGAGHHCFGYVIGDEEDSRIERQSDDGEPGGTAGAPILQVLKSRELVNVVAVVSRHYGGIKLGAGGLVRAYSGAVTAAIDSATVRSRLRWTTFRLAVPHADAGWVESALRARAFEIGTVDYGERAVLTVLCTDEAALASCVSELTAGEGEMVPSGHVWR